jgi:hypothetical protein
MGDSAQVEQESQSAPQTTADLIRATMSETYRPASRADIPLNRPGVILAAGGPERVQLVCAGFRASLIRQGAMTGSVTDAEIMQRRSE